MAIRTIKEGDKILLGKDFSKDTKDEKIIVIGLEIKDYIEYIRVYSLSQKEDRLIDRECLFQKLKLREWNQYTRYNL